MKASGGSEEEKFAFEIEEGLDNTIFALLFASDEPLSTRRIAGVLGDKSPGEVAASLERVRKKLEKADMGIMLESIAGGYQFSTKPEFAEYIARLYFGRRKQRLSRAALETLAIIAYKQPITRAEIEQVRGVSCGGVISTLMERSLIKITGKAKVLGAPFLYGTTPEFLTYLGLNSLKDLPGMEELEEILQIREKSVSQEDPEPTESTESLDPGSSDEADEESTPGGT